jgi:nucleoside recognition membrane protein YjiH
VEPEKTRIVVCMIIVLGFFGVLAAYVMLPIKGDATVMQLLVGSLISAFTSVCNYFVGTTSGSKAKDTTIANIAAANANTPPVPGPTNVAPITRTGT